MLTDNTASFSLLAITRQSFASVNSATFQSYVCSQYNNDKLTDMQQKIQIKRAYEKESPDDGFRIYVDRLWPRGLSHQTFHYDLWDKDISPSTELREWFHANTAEEWPEFEKRYSAELLANPAFHNLKKSIRDKPAVTLLYSSRDKVHNNAIVVKNLLTE